MTLLNVSKPSQIVDCFNYGKIKTKSDAEDIICALKIKYNREIFGRPMESRKCAHYEPPLPFDRRNRLKYTVNYIIPADDTNYYDDKCTYNMGTREMPTQKGVIPCRSHPTTILQNKKTCYMTDTKTSHINFNVATSKTSRPHGIPNTH